MRTIKHVLIASGLLCLQAIQAQEPGHYLHFNAGGGIHDLNYTLTNGDRTSNQLGFTANAAYSWFFTSHWGLQTGAGIHTLQGLSTINYLSKTNATDFLGKPYLYNADYKYWQEKQQVMMLDIPLALQFRSRLGENVGILASLGGKVSLPFKADYKTTSGQIVTSAEYPESNLIISDIPEYGFSTYSNRFSGTYQLNPAYSATADLGALFKMSDATDFYLGAYCNYGLNNMLIADTKPIYQAGATGVYNGVFASNQLTKVTPFSVGVKVGVYFRLGKKDSDKDGVSDKKDKCPDTPKEAWGKIGKDGCPLDSDGDGVADYLDKCPNTPKEAIGHVDTDGCPLDSDGDGVADYLDKCPKTPKEAYGKIDASGCPLDTDGDGVADYLDKCNDTPKEAYGKIDASGCPLDTDGDGVPDYLDKCPNTPKEAYGHVDAHGCPLDTDGDGIFDYKDKCPTIPGSTSNNGCPEVKKEVKALFKKALQGIQFETGKYIIKPVSFTLLNQIARTLIANPTYLIEIQGHTDNVGKAAANLTLSQKRAEAVMNYLIGTGVEAKRLTANGYGDSMPVALNTTPQGKALNRRVEFVVTFEEVISK